eukprot:gene3303-2285_t
MKAQMQTSRHNNKRYISQLNSIKYKTNIRNCKISLTKTRYPLYDPYTTCTAVNSKLNHVITKSLPTNPLHDKLTPLKHSVRKAQHYIASTTRTGHIKVVQHPCQQPTSSLPNYKKCVIHSTTKISNIGTNNWEQRNKLHDLKTQTTPNLLA